MTLCNIMTLLRLWRRWSYFSRGYSENNSLILIVIRIVRYINFDITIIYKLRWILKLAIDLDYYGNMNSIFQSVALSSGFKDMFRLLLLKFKGRRGDILELKLEKKFNLKSGEWGWRLDWTRWVCMTDVYRCTSGSRIQHLRKNDSNASMSGFPALMSGFMSTEALFESHYCFLNEHLE